MCEEAMQTEHKIKNKFNASLILVISLFVLSLLEIVFYLLEESNETFALVGSSYSTAIFIFLLIYFIYLVVKRERFYKSTIIIVGVFTLSWLLSSIPLFVTVVMGYAGAGEIWWCDYVGFYFEVAVKYFGNTSRMILYLPYTNIWVSLVLLLLVPGLFSNERVKIKNKENPEATSVTIENGEIQKVNPLHNRFRLSFIVSIIAIFLGITGIVCIIVGGFGLFIYSLLALLFGIFLFCALVVSISLYPRIHFSTYIVLGILTVMFLMSWYMMTNAYVAGYYDLAPGGYTDISFMGFMFKIVRNNPEGWVNSVEYYILPYPDFFLSAASIITISIFFSKDRKNILKLKKESPELNE
ncbi:MAG: hypothetical protein LUB56_02895 [Coprobacillus sp.]|nr:hypothetical protein [Coprobacillus sp.]